MKNFNIIIDEKNVEAYEGQTILDVAKENNISIPTLCYDERTEIYGSCGLCVCEVEGNPKLVKACATTVTDGMVVKTKTDRVIESRKTNLELLLSNHKGDCRPPCKLSCPAGTDVQGYVGLIANGEYKEALALIKESIPLPGALGRVCPHPCEYDCRRTLVDGKENPISIQFLKRFASDEDFKLEEPYMPYVAKETGKKVAIIGGGPMGLSSAYFLRQKGHDITIYDAMPKLGGMLRYGIPQYRLPKEELDKEIKIIEDMGVKIIPNTKIGKDIDFEKIKNDYDAVVLGIGAWVSTGVGCKGEDLSGVIGAIDFLQKVIRKENEDIKGKNVAIVGGGNTAMDACRTAVRLGAKKVYNIYRRTKAEMPADDIEIIEGEEEGVIFKNLTNPIEFIAGDDGKVSKVHLQIMELGEADASGRRSPIPVEGKTEMLDVDVVILGIGQAVDAKAFSMDKTRRNAISFDENTFMTSEEGVFAGGDCGNDKISIAVEAIADAKYSANVIDKYLNGEKISYKKPYYVTKKDITEKTFEDREKMFKSNMEHLSPDERKDNFEEVMKGFTEEEALADASRCLECGCHDYFECKLIKYSHEYNVEPDRLEGEINACDLNDDHPFISRDPNKCILCGLCVRVCDEIMGVSALGLVGRGFDTVVKPSLEKPLLESGCVSCGLCVNVCPTGALQEKTTMPKPVPVNTNISETTCPFCSVGCTLDFESYGNLMVKSVPNKNGIVNEGLSCGKGKWGFDAAILEGKIIKPLVKNNNGFEEISYDKSINEIYERLEKIKKNYGDESIAISISDRLTNEEIYVAKKMSEQIGAKVVCLNNRKSGLKDVIGIDISPNSMDEMVESNVILVTGFNVSLNPVVYLKMKKAAENGAKIILLNPKEVNQKMEFAHKIIYTENNLDSLKEIAKYIISKNNNINIKGYEQFEKSLEDIDITNEMAEIAEMYLNSEKSLILFQQNLITQEAAKLVSSIAVISDHIGANGDGIIQIKAKNNSQGIIQMDVNGTEDDLLNIKALICLGEEYHSIDKNKLEFLVVSDIYMTDTAKKADIIIPATGFTNTKGTYFNTEGRLLEVEPSVDEGIEYDNIDIYTMIANKFGANLDYSNFEEIQNDMEINTDFYHKNKVNQIIEKKINKDNFKLYEINENKYIEELKSTDSMMNIMLKRIPKPVK